MSKCLILYSVALFRKTPRLWEVNPAGETDYPGYHRVPAVFDADGSMRMLHATEFPECVGEGEWWIEAAAVLDNAGRVMAVQPLVPANVHLVRGARVNTPPICPIA